jgi:hypothetical protein
MKALYIKIIESKIFNFFKQQWWLGIFIGFISTLGIFPPNSLNPNRVDGLIADTYKGKYFGHITGKGSVEFNVMYILLEDSTLYNTSDKSAKKYLNSINVKEKHAKIIYQNVQNDQKSIVKLEIDGKVVCDENKWLVGIFWFCLIWVVWGGIGEIVRIWKSV